MANQVSHDSISAPGLPSFAYSYSLPQGMHASSISITYRSFVILAPLNTPVYPMQIDRVTSVDSLPPPYTPPGPAYSQYVYPYDSLLVVVVNPISFACGMGISTINVQPVQYRIAQNELWLATDISFTIHLTSTSQTPVLAQRRSTFVQKYMKDYLEGMVQNYNDVDGNMPVPPIITDYNYPSLPPVVYPDYLIVTSSFFVDALFPFKSWLRTKGYPTKIYSMENDINPNYPGVDSAEKLRNFIKARYIEGACFVLLVGNMDLVPIRYVYDVDNYTPPGLGSYQICDLYYAGLEGNWNLDGDGIWGEPHRDQPDIAADIFVGRVAATETLDIYTWVDKVINYVDNPFNVDDSYRANVILSSSDEMQRDNEGPYVAAGFDLSFFHKDASTYTEQPSYKASDPTFPSGTDIINMLSNSTPGYYVSLSHGSPVWFACLTKGLNCSNEQNCWRSGVSTNEGNRTSFPNWGVIEDVANQGREYIHSSIGCWNGALDVRVVYGIPDYPPCFAEKSLLVDGGCVAGTFNTRDGWSGVSSIIERLRAEYICGDNNDHNLARSHYATKVPAFEIPGVGHYLVYDNTFFGDPSMKVWTQHPGRFLVDRPTTLYRDIVQTINIRVKDNVSQIGLSNVLVTLTKELISKGVEIGKKVAYPFAELSKQKP